MCATSSTGVFYFILLLQLRWPIVHNFSQVHYLMHMLGHTEWEWWSLTILLVSAFNTVNGFPYACWLIKCMVRLCTCTRTSRLGSIACQSICYQSLCINQVYIEATMVDMVTSSAACRVPIVPTCIYCEERQSGNAVKDKTQLCVYIRFLSV